MMRMRRVMTLAGGMCLAPPPSAVAMPVFVFISAEELDPILFNIVGPSLSSSPPAKLKSSPPNSPLCGIASQSNNSIQ